MFRYYASPNVSAKVTQNARFEQMTKQEKLIEQKKQEIQRKLEERKLKETEEALKKLNPEAAAVVDKRGSGSSNSRNRWSSKRKADVIEPEPPSGPSGVTVRPSNVFSNDGSFLDQFKKMTGMKSASKYHKRDVSPSVITRNTCTDNKVFDELSECRSMDSSYEIYDNEMRGVPSSNERNRVNNDERSSEKGRSGRKIRSPTRRNLPDVVPSFQSSRQSHSYQSSNNLLHQENVRTSTPQSSQSRPLFSLSQTHLPDQNTVPSVYSLPAVPPPMQPALIPPPAPINPGTIPAPSPILPCSIPPPSPIQPSAIPPPSPLLPHCIPPPLPISPNTIPHPSPLSLFDIPAPRSPQKLKSANLTSRNADLSTDATGSSPPPPPVPGTFYIPLPQSPFHTNYNSDLPALSPDLSKLPNNVIKYPSKDNQRTDFVSTTSCPGVGDLMSRLLVPAEHKFTKEESPERSKDYDREKKHFEKAADVLKYGKFDNSKDDESSLTDPTYQTIVTVDVKKEEELIQSAHDSNVEISSSWDGNYISRSSGLKLEDDSIDGVPMVGCIHTGGVEPEIKREYQQDDSSQDGDSLAAARKKKRKSRWAPENEAVPIPAPVVGPVGVVAPTVLGATPVQLPNTPSLNVPGMKGPLLSQLSRNDPALMQYAIKNFGSTQLSEEDWKKAEDHYKINLLYQDMLKKRRELEKLQAAGKFKYEYDSDEETEGGTWEHKLREKEMVATQLWADELTEAAKGKHHIGDFLPPEELSRFMEKYEALKQGRPPDLSDYKEYKLKEDNIGFQMLQKLGWTEGQGLGSDGSGIVDPVNKATVRADNHGLGVERPDDVNVGDDEYDAYRKRMMLAYRFRPNPLNNPRRPYY